MPDWWWQFAAFAGAYVLILYLVHRFWWSRHRPNKTVNLVEDGPR